MNRYLWWLTQRYMLLFLFFEDLEWKYSLISPIYNVLAVRVLRACVPCCQKQRRKIEKIPDNTHSGLVSTHMTNHVKQCVLMALVLARIMLPLGTPPTPGPPRPPSPYGFLLTVCKLFLVYTLRILFLFYCFNVSFFNYRGYHCQHFIQTVHLSNTGMSNKGVFWGCYLNTLGGMLYSYACPLAGLVLIKPTSWY